MHKGFVPIKKLLTFSSDELRAFIEEKNSGIRTAITFHTREAEQEFEDRIRAMHAHGDYWLSGIAHMYLFFENVEGAAEEKIETLTKSCVEIAEHVLHEAKRGIGFVLKENDEEFVGMIIFFTLLAGYLVNIVKGLCTMTTLHVFNLDNTPEEVMRGAITQTEEAIIARYKSVH